MNLPSSLSGGIGNVREPIAKIATIVAHSKDDQLMAMRFAELSDNLEADKTMVSRTSVRDMETRGHAPAYVPRLNRFLP